MQIPTYLVGMTNSRDASGRRRVERQVIRNGKVVNANVWGVERSEASLALGLGVQDLGDDLELIEYGDEVEDAGVLRDVVRNPDPQPVAGKDRARSFPSAAPNPMEDAGVLRDVVRHKSDVTLGQALHDSGFVTFGDHIADPSDSVQTHFEGNTASRAESTDEARDLLDHWEHHNNDPEFIKEVGGREAYVAEMSRRFNVFVTLNTNSTTAEVSSALAELENLRSENL